MATLLRKVLTSLHGRLLGLASDGSLIVKGHPDQAVLTAAPGSAGSNICNVTLQAQDNEGFNVARVLNGKLWLSDAASGAGLTATTASGGISITTGAQLGALTAAKAIDFQTDATGKAVLQITDTVKTAFKVCAVLDKQSLLSPVIATLATASYG